MTPEGAVAPAPGATPESRSMMRLEARGLSLRLTARRSLFGGLDLDAQTGHPVAVTGPNGAGKSTLLRLLYGFAVPTAGQVHYLDETGQRHPAADMARQIALVAPALELPGMMTARALIEAHGRLRPLEGEPDELLARCGLGAQGGVPVRALSSGQRQRLRLTLCLFDPAPVVLLDEPGMNLDTQGWGWLEGRLHELFATRLVIIASNEERELALCPTRVRLPAPWLNL